MPAPRPPRRGSVRLASLVVALAGWASSGFGSPGCASSGSFDAGVFRAGGVDFQIAPLPAGWRRISMTDADLVYRDDSHDASVLINGHCNQGGEDVPLSALTEQLIMGTTERQFRLEETIPMDAREARHTLLSAKLDGVPMDYDIYVMKKNGCIYDLVYVGPPQSVEGGKAAFEQFVRGFHTLEAGARAARQ